MQQIRRQYSSLILFMTIAVPQGWNVREITPTGVQERYRVLASSDMDKEGLDVLQQDPAMVVEKIDKNITPAQLESLLTDTQNAVHGLIFRTTINDLLRDYPDILRKASADLRILVRGGIGVSDRYPLAAAEKGIAVMRTPEANRRSVYEWTMKMMEVLLNPLLVEQMRKFKMNEQWIRDTWSLEELREPMKGKSLFVIGAGGIGSRVAKSAREKGMKVLFIDPKVPFLEGCTSVEMEQGLQQADLITVHVDGEKMVLGPEQLAKIRKASLINTARGKVVDPKALLGAIQKGTVRSAAVDVHWTEEKQHFDDNASKDLSQHPLVFPSAHLLGSEIAATRENTFDASQKMSAGLQGGRIRDGWNTGDISLEGLFNNGETSVLELMNEDIPGVHDAVYARLTEFAGRRINRGTQSTALSPFPVFKSGTDEESSVKLAHHLVQLDLRGVPEQTLRRMLETSRQIQGVIKAHLFQFTPKC